MFSIVKHYIFFCGRDLGMLLTLLSCNTGMTLSVVEVLCVILHYLEVFSACLLGLFLDLAYEIVIHFICNCTIISTPEHLLLDR